MFDKHLDLGPGGGPEPVVRGAPVHAGVVPRHLHQRCLGTLAGRRVGGPGGALGPAPGHLRGGQARLEPAGQGGVIAGLYVHFFGFAFDFWSEITTGVNQVVLI